MKHLPSFSKLLNIENLFYFEKYLNVETIDSLIQKGIESNTLSLEVIHKNDNDSESVNRDFAFTYDIEEYIKEYDIQNISLVYQDLYKGKETISIKIQ